MQNRALSVPKNCHCDCRKVCGNLLFCHCEHRKVCGNPFFHFPVIANAVRRAAIRSPFCGVLRILSCFALRMTNHFVIATTVKPAIGCRSVIANAARRVAILLSFLKSITDSFVLCTQNDKPFCHCNYRKTCDWPSLCHCERRKARGNPFPLLGYYGFFRALHSE